MAFGYAKSTGKVGVYSVVPGPGVLNSTAALCTAYGASTPILCVTGEVPTDFIGSGKGHLHELPDQLATLRTLTKWSALRNPDFVQLAQSFGVSACRVSAPGDLRIELERAIALEAPVLIEVSVDSNDEVSPWEFLMPPSRQSVSI